MIVDCTGYINLSKKKIVYREWTLNAKEPYKHNK